MCVFLHCKVQLSMYFVYYQLELCMFVRFWYKFIYFVQAGIDYLRHMMFFVCDARSWLVGFFALHSSFYIKKEGARLVVVSTTS